jgi:hypothetical protein
MGAPGESPEVLTPVRRVARWFRAHRDRLAYLAGALACTLYLNDRADLVPRWGQWYMPAGAGQPFILLQVRAFLSGRLAVLPTTLGATDDYDWGRGGLHQQWGMGVPILATPFHLLGRMFGAPGFPDDVRLLVWYAATATVLAYALHHTSVTSHTGQTSRTSHREPTALVVSIGAAGFVMTFPTFVGMLSVRLLVYEHTIAMGALWSILLLSGVLLLLAKCTPRRLLLVCVAAAFSLLVRPPLAVYGATTFAIALVIAYRAAVRPKWIAAAAVGYAAASSTYFVLNTLRFGSPFVAGFENCVSGTRVNRLNRWGFSFSKVPLTTAAKEMFATLFSLDPLPKSTMTPPPRVQPYVSGERWREYYSPTFDKIILVVWLAAFVLVCWRIGRRRLWRRDADLGGEVAAVVGAWALPPSVVLFFFYARIGNMVTRYATDLFPAAAASALCVGMGFVDTLRRRSPGAVPGAQIAIASAVGLYLASWHGWGTHAFPPIDRKGLDAQLALVDQNMKEPLPAVPDHFECGAPRGSRPIRSHLGDWRDDCTFASGMVFAMPHDRCVSFAFKPSGAQWEAADAEALAGFRVHADFDALEPCGAPRVEGDIRRVTMCDPCPPKFLLEGMRLYSAATLDPKLEPVDRLKLVRIEGTPSCP